MSEKELPQQKPIDQPKTTLETLQEQIRLQALQITILEQQKTMARLAQETKKIESSETDNTKPRADQNKSGRKSNHKPTQNPKTIDSQTIESSNTDNTKPGADQNKSGQKNKRFHKQKKDTVDKQNIEDQKTNPQQEAAQEAHQQEGGQIQQVARPNPQSKKSAGKQKEQIKVEQKLEAQKTNPSQEAAQEAHQQKGGEKKRKSGNQQHSKQNVPAGKQGVSGKTEQKKKPYEFDPTEHPTQTALGLQLLELHFDIFHIRLQNLYTKQDAQRKELKVLKQFTDEIEKSFQQEITELQGERTRITKNIKKDHHKKNVAKFEQKYKDKVADVHEFLTNVYYQISKKDDSKVQAKVKTGEVLNEEMLIQSEKFDGLEGNEDNEEEDERDDNDHQGKGDPTQK